MKAKFLSTIVIAALAGIFSSCDMNLAPVGVLDQSNAIQSVNDARSYRNGFYTSMRSLASSDFYSLAEIQADCFNGLTINGNRMGTFANGDVLSSDGDITSYWYSLYRLINNVNYFLEVTEPLYQKAVEDNKVADAQAYEQFIAEAHFFRGYFYAVMFDRWCVQYKPELGDKEGMGLPIVTIYNPTADRSKYPARSTMNETIKFIQDEMALGYSGIMKYEELDDSNLVPMAPYLSHYTIAAAQARFALWISDYDQAINKAKEVINSGIYKLAGNNTNPADEYYPNMWINDNSKEIIFMPYVSTQELTNAYGSAWISSQVNQADYIPVPGIIEKLMEGYNQMLKRGDIRFTSFVEARALSTTYGTIKAPTFVKFPGNPALQTTTTNNLVNKPKPFRLAEMYLIVAEASYRKGDANAANEALETLENARYKGRTYESKTGTDLFNEIVLQRTLELCGEGFRLSDLRRWGMGFTRSDNYTSVKMTGIDKTDINQIITPAGLMVTYTSDDHRYTWPIPSKELDVNPQMAGQQNPGY